MSSQNSKSSGVLHASTATSSDEGEKRSEPVTIEICGRRLAIRSDREDAFVQRLASHIDETVDDLRKAAPRASTSKLLMLASMTVAEELYETREEIDEMRQQLAETTERIFDLIDQVEEA